MSSGLIGSLTICLLTPTRSFYERTSDFYQIPPPRQQLIGEDFHTHRASFPAQVWRGLWMGQQTGAGELCWLSGNEAISIDAVGNQAAVHTVSSPYPHRILAVSSP